MQQFLLENFEGVVHKIEELYLKQYSHSVNIMARILKDHAGAEDVVQEAFCRAWKFYSIYDPEKGKLESWFNAILFNALRDYQSASRFGYVVYNPEISADDVLEGIKDRKVRRDFLLSKIEETINPIHRYVLELFFINGYTSTEISQVVEKMTQSNVTTIVTRFKERLK